MAEVKALFGGGITGEPDPEIIDLIEGALARAKRGEIDAIAISEVDPGGAYRGDWAGKAGTGNALFLAANLTVREMLEKARGG